MDKNEFEEYINLAVSTGADFAEIYYEDAKYKVYRLNDSKLDTIDTNYEKGIGIRIVSNNESYYTSTSVLTKENITNQIKKLLKSVSKKEKRIVKLTNLVDKRKKVKIQHDDYPINKKKEFLYTVDKTAREVSDLIVQVSTGIVETDKEFIIANSDGKFVTSNYILTRLTATIYAEKDGEKQEEFVDLGKSIGYEIMDDFNIKEKITNAANNAVEKLDAKDFKGGELPVILAPGFGAVIFHEACGHGLEATSVAPHLSVFSDDLNKKVASEKVTLIDDGTIKDAWGSSIIDDEGEETHKNVLIEKGILKKYLVDKNNEKQMNMKSNGCGRRQDYKYPTTSRMSNTFLAPGTDKIEDMIKSIDLGVYCLKMSGGSVNPATGDFNFAVSTARLIENGKVKHQLKGITLIGNSKDILKNVEMVSDDLEISAGYCGSKSGTIPVTVGQPTIKVSKILVGGKE